MSSESRYEKLKLEALNRKTVEEFKKSKKIPVVIILDQVRSMHNVGSVFRTADGFSIEKIYLCGITPVPPHREIQKTALGATESVDWEHREDIVSLVDELRKDDYKIVGIEQVTSSTMLQEFVIDRKDKFALVLGNEVEGISEQLLKKVDTFVEIPQSGTKHSLNISVCAGIILWEWYKVFKK